MFTRDLRYPKLETTDANALSCFHGAFTCSCRPGYTVHLICAMKDDVWDGKEFENEPKEELEDEFEDESEEEIKEPCKQM